MNSAVAAREEWLAARKPFLKTEKQFSKLRDELAQEQRALTLWATPITLPHVLLPS